MKGLSQGCTLLKRGQYLAPNCCTYSFQDHLVGMTKYSTPVETGEWHSHEKHILSYVLTGKNQEFRKTKCIDRSDGSLTFYRPYELHKNHYAQFPSVHISIELEASFLEKYNYSEAYIEQAVINNHNSKWVFLHLLSEATMGGPLSGDSTEMTFIEFLEKSNTPRGSANIPSFMHKVKAAIHDNWNTYPSLAYLSEAVAVHPITISKYFRKYFHCSLSEYLSGLKIDQALELIKTKNRSLNEISHLCGFSDQSHFIRVFKAKTGYLPKHFQKLIR